MENLFRRWRWKSIFLMQTECLNRCAKIYLYAKSSWTSYRLQKYRYYITCIVYAYLQHVCKQILCEFFYSFIWQVSEAFASVDISISVSVFPSCVLPWDIYCAGAGMLLTGCCQMRLFVTLLSGHLVISGQPSLIVLRPHQISRDTASHKPD